MNCVSLELIQSFIHSLIMEFFSLNYLGILLELAELVSVLLFLFLNYQLMLFKFKIIESAL
jgi:hypothetical protein